MTIIAASIPVLRPLFKNLPSSVKRRTHSTRTRTGTSRSGQGTESGYVLSSGVTGRHVRLSEEGSETNIFSPAPKEDGLSRGNRDLESAGGTEVTVTGKKNSGLV